MRSLRPVCLLSVTWPLRNGEFPCLIGCRGHAIPADDPSPGRAGCVPVRLYPVRVSAGTRRFLNSDVHIRSARRVDPVMLARLVIDAVHVWRDHRAALPLPSLVTTDSTFAWLCATDPAIRWQVMRDLSDAPESAWHAVRLTVETEGWGARLLGCQDNNGLWAGGAFVPHGFDWSTIKSAGQPWTATCWALDQLREFGLDPASPSAQRTVALVAKHGRWDHDGQPFWDGEVEECINGRTVANGAYFGVNVTPIVERLLGEVQPDGGWNCERCNGSRRSSFHTTLNVLEGLLAFERVSGASDAVRAARQSGEEFLLARGLFRRGTNGEVVDPKYLSFLHPHRWRYDILRALDYFRDRAQYGGAAPDARLSEAIAILRSKQQVDGTWLLDWQLPGQAWFHLNDGPGEPSAWITLKALRVLRWWDAERGVAA